jgi:hypothetical protein
MSDPADSDVSLSDDEYELLTAGAEGGGGGVAGNQLVLPELPGKSQIAAGLVAFPGVVQVCVLVVRQFMYCE